MQQILEAELCNASLDTFLKLRLVAGALQFMYNMRVRAEGYTCQGC